MNVGPLQDGLYFSQIGRSANGTTHSRRDSNRVLMSSLNRFIQDGKIVGLLRLSDKLWGAHEVMQN